MAEVGGRIWGKAGGALGPLPYNKRKVGGLPALLLQHCSRPPAPGHC